MVAESSQPVSMGELMRTYEKSERSIHYDVLEIRDALSQYGIHFENKSGKGYTIPEVEKPECLSLLKSGKLDHGSKGNEDLYAACFTILYTADGPVTMDDLSMKANCSRSTLTRVLKEFNSSHEAVSFRTGNKGVSLDGDEYMLRSLACNQRQLRGNRETQSIAEGIRKANEVFDVWMTADVFLGLQRFVEVSLLRGRTKHPQFNESFLLKEEREYAEYLLDLLKEKKEDCDIACIVEFLIHANVVVARDRKLQEELQPKVEALVEALAGEAAKQGIVVSQAELQNDLMKHFSSLAKCMAYGIRVPENPLLLNIKNSYRIYYEIARKCTAGWQILPGETLSEDEVAYAAIYLYKDSHPGEEKRKRAMVVCATGKGLSSLLAKKIAGRFPQLEIAGVESAYHAGRINADVDLVISTVEIPDTWKPVVVISPVFNEADARRIEARLEGGAQPAETVPAGRNDDSPVLTRDELSRSSRETAGVILALTDLFTSLPEGIQLNSDQMLAMTLHTILAMPRWCEGHEDAFAGKKLKEYRRQDPLLAERMDSFFARIEELVGFTVCDEEKIPFYLYIQEGKKKV